MTETIDQVRAWKDEDYREAVGLDQRDHPAGDIDLAPVQPWGNESPVPISYPGDTICLSIVNNCFTSWPYICTTVNCYTELVESRN